MIIDAKQYAGLCSCGREHQMATAFSVVEAGCLPKLGEYMQANGLNGKTVAVYDENGKGWIIQACSNGTIYLLDGLTGDVVNTLAVNGVIEGSPAVYGDTMVIGTTGKGTSYIYGIKIK